MRQFALSPFESESLDLDYLNYKFRKAEPRKILAWCVSNIPSLLVQKSDFNIDDLVITDILYRQLQPKTRVPVIFIDTLHHFSQTLELVAKSQQIYHLDMKIYRPLKVDSRKAFAAKYGQNLWKKNLEKFNFLTKIEPWQRSLTELKPIAWIHGHYPLDVNQEKEAKIFEMDEQGRLKINPLVYWSRTESWAYAYEYDLVYNSLYDLGYSVIGDEPLTQLS